MLFDFNLIRSVYSKLTKKIDDIKSELSRPLSLTEKILYSHLHKDAIIKPFMRGDIYIAYNPDRLAMQDATAQMALLQFMQTGKDRVSIPTTLHCDHLIQVGTEASEDLNVALETNREVYEFLESASDKFGIGFWKPGAGIIHQLIFENYAFPGGMMLGTDSHTVNAGGLGMLAIGVGGSDAVEVMAGMPWELRYPKIIGINLTGRLSGWASPKDVILKIAGILTVRGGTGYILEYFGEGAESISCTGKGTICNMGAEIGAITSVFGYDRKMEEYLIATGREDVAEEAGRIAEYLTGDTDVYENPEMHFDQIIDIDLSQMEPQISGPFSPDKAYRISRFAEAVKKYNYPEKIAVGLIGSCTNSSYEDLTRAASIAKQAVRRNLKVKSEFTITPGSEQVRCTAERDGLTDIFKNIGGVILANACGPCIGQWARHGTDKKEKNTIVTSFNRNFARRNDGNPNTHAFIASPEIVTALVIAGNLTFNPLKDHLINEDGKKVRFDEPKGEEIPDKGFAIDNTGYRAPSDEGTNIDVIVKPGSDRLQLLRPFPEWDGKDLTGLNLLIKIKGKCTTDHISMAGPWLKYRGHLDNISDNLLIGAVNYFNDHTNHVKNQLSGNYMPVPDAAKLYKKYGAGSIIIGDNNYGEGSSREHAAMEPRHLGIKVVLAKSFARIHETNLKRQGILALTFRTMSDFDKILEDDTFDIAGIKDIAHGAMLQVIINHPDGTKEEILSSHSYNKNQIEWFRAGSALNYLRKHIKNTVL